MTSFAGIKSQLAWLVGTAKPIHSETATKTIKIGENEYQILQLEGTDRNVKHTVVEVDYTINDHKVEIVIPKGKNSISAYQIQAIKLKPVSVKPRVFDSVALLTPNSSGGGILISQTYQPVDFTSDGLWAFEDRAQVDRAEDPSANKADPALRKCQFKLLPSRVVRHKSSYTIPKYSNNSKVYFDSDVSKSDGSSLVADSWPDSVDGSDESEDDEINNVRAVNLPSPCKYSTVETEECTDSAYSWDITITAQNRESLSSTTVETPVVRFQQVGVTA
jgi:hypothetical protein